MSEMKPLLDESVSADAARLLRSADSDGPVSPESEKIRTLAALGLLSSTGLAASASPLRRALGSSSRAATFGAIAVVAAFAGVVAVRSWSTAPAEMPTSGPAAVAPTAEMQTAAPPVPSTTDTVRVEDLPTAAASQRADVKAPERGSSFAAKRHGQPGLEDELAAIDAARAALASGRADVALSNVNRYHRTFHEGRFTEEADALEIQALAALGRLEEARAKGERFLASRPGSPYERRVRSSMGLSR